ncbi:MAG: PAS domain-containing sensor histidine kinase [Gammaproteobacteria bacterium]|nr:PAS domain-containing sensor histidine kinase [Gammaproteobacteria bacterium]NND54977.1 PAS domain-containing sensor histidine kinase [Gammaproteobacteria bacterium]
MDREISPEQDLKALKQAFDIFTEASGQLGSSWRDLEQQVAQLQDQLHTAQDERRQEAERNKHLVQRLSTVIETLPGGLVVLDADGLVNEVNSAAREMFAEPLEGMRWSDVVTRDFAGRDGAQADYVLRDGRRLALAQRAIVRSADDPADDNHPAEGRVLLFTDMTEQRKIESLFERHRRLASMGEMAAALAHQVRTPLASAMLYASNATRADLTDAYRMGLLDKSITCLRDMEQLVMDMLSFARGDQYIDAAFQLDDLLAAVGTSVAPVLGDEQSLTIASASRAMTLTGNREALAGALINLVRNALQAAGDTARVVVSTDVSASDVRISVSDNGPGVAEEQVEKIFEPFVSLRSDGTGLGLAVVRSVAKAHGGDIGLTENSRDGATFTLQLPLQKKSDQDDLASRRASGAEKQAAGVAA